MEGISTEPAQTLRILCFGDSLTEGYTRMGQNWTPYSEEMKTVLDERGRKGLKIDVITEGRSGELASAGGFLRRMETACASVSCCVFHRATNKIVIIANILFKTLSIVQIHSTTGYSSSEGRTT